MSEQNNEFLDYPTNRVLAVIDKPDHVRAAVENLARAGFGADAVDVLCGEEGARRLDVTGEDHGLISRLTRILQSFGAEHERLKRHVEELRAGRFLICVYVGEDEERKGKAHVTLNSAGAHYINYYSEWSIEQLEP
ncbi:MAG: hypothetical protein ACRD0K_16160 [Egibacteraceae bacterium]